MTVKVTVDKLASIVKSISDLARKDVLIGIPEENADRKEDDSPNNATLGYIHEFGSPAQGIPPRPFLNTGVEDSIPAVMPVLKSAALAALDGSESGVNRYLNRAGTLARDSVKGKFETGEFAPLKPSTIRNRHKQRGDKNMRAGEKKYLQAMSELAMTASDAQTYADIKPLVNTGQLRNSISYVVRKK